MPSTGGKDKTCSWLLLIYTNCEVLIGKGKEFVQALNHLEYSQFKENPSQKALEVRVRDFLQYTIIFLR